MGKLYALKKCYIDGVYYKRGAPYKGKSSEAPGHLFKEKLEQLPEPVVFPRKSKEDQTKERLAAAEKKKVAEKKKKAVKPAVKDDFLS